VSNNVNGMAKSVPFIDRLIAAVQARQTPVMVGLDPRVDQLPAALQPSDVRDPRAVAESFRRFSCDVIDTVAPLVPVVKPQAAFFEQLGPAGMVALGEVIDHAVARGVLVVLDGKRNDIGTTAEAYAEGWLGRKPASPWGADALTVSPYLGDDSLEPFVKVGQPRGAGIFVLVKTSNPGGKLLQDLESQGRSLYRHVAEYVERLAQQTRGGHAYGDVGAVVGATYPEQLAELRATMPGTWFLVPGFGAQGGTARDCAAAFDAEGLGGVVNNSRGILFAHARKEYRDRFAANQWQQAVEAATRDMIAQLRAETTAGRLVR
jgi:orotidine-5'-phosphate decarboxylase